MMESCDIKTERDCLTTHFNIKARYFAGNILSLGTITEISEICMCISTRFILPLNSLIEFHIPCKKNILRVPAKVNRYFNRQGLSDIMCVEILNPTEEYKEFARSFDKRLHKRFTMNMEIALETREANYTARTRNVSSTGLHIMIEPSDGSPDFSSQTDFEVVMVIPQGGPLRLHCTKKWHHPPPHEPWKGMGVEILDPPLSYQEFLNTIP